MKHYRVAIALLVLLVVVGVVAASAQSQQTIIYDDFVGPGGTSLATHTPDTNLSNGAWSIGGGPGLIFWGQGLRASNTGTYDVYATIDAGVSDGTVGASWIPQEGENASFVNGGVVFRYVSPTSYWLVNYFQNGVYLRRMTPSGFVMVGSAAVPSPFGSWHGIQVRLDGPSIQVWWDGQQKIQATDWANVSATKHGIWVLSLYDAGSLFGDFSVVGVPPPPPVATVTVAPASLTLPVAGTKSGTATGYSAAGTVIPSATFTWTSSNASIASVGSTGPTSAAIVGGSAGSATITATSSNGVTKTMPVTVTSTCIGQCVYDELVGSPGTALTTHTPDVNVMGGSWSIGGSPSLIFWGSGLRVSNHGTTSVYATIESGASNGTVGASWYPLSGENQATVNGGVVFRYLNASSYLVAYYWQGRLYLAKMTASGLQPISDAALNAQLDTWHALQVRLDGPSIQVWWDNEQRIAAVDWTNVTATDHGLWAISYDAGSLFGDFAVTGAAPPPPVTSVVVTPASASIPVAGSKSVSATGYAGTVWVPSATFAWTSSNTAVATVQATSQTTAAVTGVGPGTATITATSADGPLNTQTVSITATCLGPCVTDAFAGTSGTDLQPHVPEVNVMGGAWTVSGGTGIQLHNGGIRPSGTGGFVRAVIESGTANGQVGITWLPAGDNPGTNVGVIARYADDNNFILASYQSGRVYLSKMTPAGLVSLANVAVANPGSTATALAVVLDGPGIEVWWAGQRRLQIVELANITSTKHGVTWYTPDDNGSSISDFSVIGAEISEGATAFIGPATNVVRAGVPSTFTGTLFDTTNAPIHWADFTWQTSDPAVATVDKSGLQTVVVTGHSSGAFMLTGSADGISVSRKVLVTVAESETGVRVMDTFTGSGGLSVSTHAPDVNTQSSSWVVSGNPDIGMFNDRIRATGNGGEVLASVDAGTANGTVHVQWTPISGDGASQPNGALVFRYASPDSYWLATYWQSGIYLSKMTPTGRVDVAVVGVVPAWNVINFFDVLLSGSTIQFWWNGALGLQIEDAYNIGATRHGVRWSSSSDAGSVMDDFFVNADLVTPKVPVQPPPVCLNGVWPPVGQGWPAAGGTDTVTLSAPLDCAWQASTPNQWIHLTTTNGVGGAYLEYSVEPNTGAERIGEIVINGWSFPIIQAGGSGGGGGGGRSDNATCEVALAVGPETTNSVRVTVTAPPGCLWTVTGVPEGLQVSPASGTGVGDIIVQIPVESAEDLGAVYAFFVGGTPLVLAADALTTSQPAWCAGTSWFACFAKARGPGDYVPPPLSEPTLVVTDTTVPSLTVVVQGGPGNPTDWVGLFQVTGAIDLGWQYLNGSIEPPSEGLTSATLGFVAPAQPGEYEFRLYANNGNDLLARSAPFALNSSVPELTAHRDRLLADWATSPQANSPNDVCAAWNSIPENAQQVFIWNTHRLHELGILQDVTKLYAIRGRKDDDSCGGIDHNRTYMSMTPELQARLRGAAAGNRSILPGFRETHDLACLTGLGECPHIPFTRQAETVAGQPTGQIQFFPDPDILRVVRAYRGHPTVNGIPDRHAYAYCAERTETSRSSANFSSQYAPISYAGSCGELADVVYTDTLVVDPRSAYYRGAVGYAIADGRSFEMDQDYNGLAHDSAPYCKEFPGQGVGSKGATAYEQLIGAPGWGWRPTACAQ